MHLSSAHSHTNSLALGAEAPVDVVDLLVHGAEERLVARRPLLPEAHMTFIRNPEAGSTVWTQVGYVGD